MTTPINISLRPVHNTDSDDFAYALGLLVASFPRDEYRDPDAWAALTRQSPVFSNRLIEHGGNRCGLVTTWQFPTFTYVEHLAIDPSLRGHGLGARVVARLLEESPLPLVLEVEKPLDDLSRRRIAFYERCGLTLLPYTYVQPPYRTGSQVLPMFIMSSEQMNEAKFEDVRATLYREAYGRMVKSLCLGVDLAESEDEEFCVVYAV